LGRLSPCSKGFESGFIETSGASIFSRRGGEGPAVLLLHGHPRTSATWHRVAPLLVDRGCTVVCPDLRGYGRSRGPAPVADHSAHCKRAVATDMLEVMHALGHNRFMVAGHDRGSYVALRLALDRPQAVTAVAFLDGIPITEHLERMSPEFATAYWHWFFFAQPEIPERVINADPDSWYAGDPAAMGAANYEEWREAMRKPEVVRAMLEDYRAGLTIDLRHEQADRAAGVKITCPTLVLWSEHDDLEDLHGDPLAIWTNWTDELSGHRIDSGHHMAEDNPKALADALASFSSATAREWSARRRVVTYK
jgi:haloacetate dehalogenase